LKNVEVLKEKYNKTYKEKQLLSICKKAIEKHGKTSKKGLLCEIIINCPQSVRNAPAIAEFLDRIVADRSAPVDLRLKVLAVRSSETSIDIIDDLFAQYSEKTSEILNPGTYQYSGDKIKGLYVPHWINSRTIEEKKRIVGILGRLDLREGITILLARKFLAPNECLEFLKKCISHENTSVRKEAVEGICAIDDPSIIPVLAKVAKDESDKIRSMIIQPLSEFETDSALEALVPLLDDKNSQIRKAAFDALSRIRKKKEEKELWKDWLKKVKKDKPNTEP